MGIIGSPRAFHHKYKFLVEIDGFDNTRAGFRKCSALEAEVSVVEYKEGGALIPDKSPGGVKFTDITLERGVCKDFDIYKWFKQVVDLSSGPDLVGKKTSQVKRGVSIVQLDRDDSELRRWDVTNAFPTKFVAGDWDNDANEVVIEQLVLTYDFFDKG